MKAYVISGGPGIGKTTTIELLSARGYPIVPESARTIIEEEMLKGSDVLPWKNLAAFQEKVADLQLGKEKDLIKDEVVFMDRGLVDGYGYCTMGNIAAPKTLEENARGRYEKIFLLERLPGYITDTARIENLEFAEKVHQAIHDAYVHFGYEPILVPVLPPEERVDFILNSIK